MRVLWVFDVLSPTMLRVAETLASRTDVQLEVMCNWGGPPPFNSDRIPHQLLHCRNKIDFSAQAQIRARLVAGQFDVVHAYTSKNLANVLGASRGLRPSPKIIGYRGTVSQLSIFDPANWITFWHPRVAKIICVCQATEAALLKSRVPAHKLATVWEGCEPEGLQTPPRSARQQFNIPADAFVVGTVANMRPVKGIDLLLQGAAEHPGLRDVCWLLIGAVDDPRIRRWAEDPRIADRVRLPGQMYGAGRLAGLFDVYAAPSRMEGLSMSIMEAMAQRVCPLVTRVGGSPELVEHERQGLVVPPENPAALAAAIVRLRDDPALREQLAEAAERRVRETFSIAAWTERLYGVYREVLGLAAATRSDDAQRMERAIA